MGEGLTVRTQNAIDNGWDPDLPNPGEPKPPYPPKLKEMFEEAVKQAGDEGAKRFVEAEAIFLVKGKNYGQTGKLRAGEILFSEINFPRLQKKIVDNELQGLGIGYSIVMSPDGRIATHLTADVSNYMTNLSSVRERLNVLSEILGERVYNRGGQHAILQRSGFDASGVVDSEYPQLWGLAMRQKRTQDSLQPIELEVGFMSAQVNYPRRVGRSISGAEDRANGILIRTSQKQAIRYLQNFFDNKYGKNKYKVGLIEHRSEVALNY